MKENKAYFNVVISIFQINVLVDTGSSNFAVAAAAHPYVPYYFHIEK